MKLELTDQEFRYLLDLVYIGNWVLNSTRGDDRIEEYDQVEGKVFSHCVPQGMPKLVERYRGSLIPSRAFACGRGHFQHVDRGRRRKLAAGTRAELGSCGHLDCHGLRRMSPGRAVYDPFPERQVEGNPAGV